MSTPDRYHGLFRKLEETLFAETDERTMLDALDYLDFKKWISRNLLEER